MASVDRGNCCLRTATRTAKAVKLMNVESRDNVTLRNAVRVSVECITQCFCGKGVQVLISIKRIAVAV